MERKISFKGFKKKALISLTALSISGLLPVGAAWAQGELVAELVAEQGSVLSGKPGETIQVPVNISVTPYGTKQTNAVTVTANFAGNASQTVTFNANELNVKKQVFLEFTIPQTNELTVKPQVKMTSTDITGNDQVSDSTADYITIDVIQAPVDATAPIVTLNNPVAGIYNEESLPSKFSFNLDEAGEVFVNRASVGNFEAGTHELALPAVNEGENSVSLFAKDASGNKSAAVSFSFIYDSIKPMVAASTDRDPNSNGWYNEDVVVSFSASDENGSGIDQSDGPVTVSTEGAGQEVTGTATDKAGNIGTGSIKLNIDKTKPAINIEDGGTYTLNQQVSWTASDALSGLASASTGTVDTSIAGNRTQRISVTDNAGNTAEKTISYKVVYNFGGILQPINPDGSSVFKAGSTVPVKFQLKDAQGAFVTTDNAAIYYAKSSNQVFGADLEAASTSAATSGNLFRYDYISNQYVFNLSTKGLTAGTYKITIKLGDSTTQTVQISLK